MLLLAQIFIQLIWQQLAIEHETVVKSFKTVQINLWGCYKKKTYWWSPLAVNDLLWVTTTNKQTLFLPFGRKFNPQLMVGDCELEFSGPFVHPLEPLPDGPHPAQKNTTLLTNSTQQTDSSSINTKIRTLLITLYRRRVAILRFIKNFDITVINLVCVCECVCVCMVFHFFWRKRSREGCKRQCTLNGQGRPSALHCDVTTHSLSLRWNVHLYL